MTNHFTYKPVGVCCTEISFDLVDGILHNVDLYGGCRGNTTGINRLVEGMPAREVYIRTKGVECHGGHSCPGELANAIAACYAEMGETL